MTNPTRPGPARADASLSPAMLRELRSLHQSGELSAPAAFGNCGALWFHARDRVIGALQRRGLIEDAAGDWSINDAGRAAMARAHCAGPRGGCDAQ